MATCACSQCSGTSGTDSPSSNTSPVVGRYSPPINDSAVDLPAPFSPCSAIRSPAWISRLKSHNTGPRP